MIKWNYKDFISSGFFPAPKEGFPTRNHYQPVPALFSSPTWNVPAIPSWNRYLQPLTDWKNERIETANWALQIEKLWWCIKAAAFYGIYKTCSVVKILHFDIFWQIFGQISEISPILTENRPKNAKKWKNKKKIM